MKKILLSLVTIMGIGALVFGASQAFFSDVETSTGNLFQAGAIDLLIDSEAHYGGFVCDNNVWVEDEFGDDNNSYPQLEGKACGGTWESTDLTVGQYKFFDYSDIKPGDTGENTISITVENNDAYVCMNIDNMQDLDNTLTEPEGLVDPDGLTSGELAENLHFTAWLDQGTIQGFQNDDTDPAEGDNIWQGETAEPLLFSNQSGPASDVLGGKTYTLADAASPFNPFTGGVTHYIGLQWCAGTMTISGDEITCNGATMGNEAQTDSLTADIHFYAEQSRNNEGFSCAEVTWPTPEPTEFLAESITTWPQTPHLWQAEARIGNDALNGDWEVGLKNAGSYVVAGQQFNWPNGDPVPFTLTFDGDILTFVVDSGGTDVTATYDVDNVGTNVSVIVKSATSGATASFDNLMVDDGGGYLPVSPDSNSHTGPTGGPNGLTIAGISIVDGFNLKGDITFDWDLGDIPTNSELDFQVIVN